ncbi:hypothetical protein BT63DRAFT_450031 [Microthyrium microscopicum]|uniref:PLP-dependent transferase n=1 Tax=Microthyrium microscopicum TaxID=703497 RepID=A0A6A6UUC5_9PEZI|nr:hypothetical protein BT63DRAFT_450031 [Microthyrium microscopicum]
MASPSSESVFSEESSNSLFGLGAADLLRNRVYIQVLGSKYMYPAARKPEYFNTEFAANSNQTTGVEFVLRPPTITDENELKTLSATVYRQWLKKLETSASMLGCPEIQFDEKFNCFVLFLPGPEDLVPDLGLVAALDIIESIILAECVAKHLTEGGDDRLHLDPDTGVNKYFCPPRPVPDETIQRSSCTCSAPSRCGFVTACNLLQQIWLGAIDFDDACEDVRTKMKRALRLETPSYEVILHPSGSDAELLPLAYALSKARAIGCSNIVNIVVAAGEVGSGTAAAAGGLHFNEYVPSGRLVKSGERVTGFPTNTVVIDIPPRTSTGCLVFNYDNELKERVEAACKSYSNPFFVIHAVDGSKTGLRLPSQSVLDALRQRLKERLLVVLDACQGRSDGQELDWYLSREAMVLVTASKFFGAPGFCGAVLVPQEISLHLETYKLDVSGLGDYITKYEIAHSLPRLRHSLPEGPKNIGLLLRWACGVTEMERFTEMGSAARHVIRQWVEVVERQVKKRNPYLELLDNQQRQPKTRRDVTRLGGYNSVISIKILGPDGTHYLDTAKLRRIHQLLTIDASRLLPEDTPPDDIQKVIVQCYVGQPVNLGKFGVLRMAMGAPLACDLAIDMDRFEVVAPPWAKTFT